MGSPEDPYPWLPVEAVLDHLRILGPRVEAEEAAVSRARLAAADVVERNRRDLAISGEFVATPAVVEAGVLLAARLYARTGSPVGVASFGEYAQSVLRSDPDVSLLLGIGRNAKPACG